MLSSDSSLNTTMSSPQVIFGCASVRAAFTERSSIEEIATALKAAGALRVDTAAKYPPNSPGLSEKLIGATHYGDLGFQISTKIYTSGDGKGSLIASAIEKSLVRSLKSLDIAKVGECIKYTPSSIIHRANIDSYTLLSWT